MTQRKAKRKLTDIDFSNEGAHIALVSKDQGHGANGHHYALVMKAANFSDEFLEKASKVTVTLSIEEYLSKFFGMYYEDAEVLSRVLGFTTERMEDEAEDRAEGEKEWNYEDYLNEKVASIQVMKQLYESENMTDVLSNLSEDDYLQMLQDQQTIEKAFKKIDAEKNKPAKAKVKTKVIEQDNPTDSVEKSTEEVTSVASEVINEEAKSSVVTKHKEKKSMTKEVQVIEQTTEVEVIAKSQYDEIQKAMQVQAEQLQKALEQVELFKQEKLEAIAKSRNAAIKDALKDDAKAEVIAKSLRSDLDDTEFQSVVKALADITVQLEKSALFQEQGASVETETNAEDPLIKLMKSKYQNSK